MRVKPRPAAREESSGQHVPEHSLGADRGRGVERVRAGVELSCANREKERLACTRQALATADRWGHTGSHKYREDLVLVRYLGRSRGRRAKPQAPVKSDDVARRLHAESVWISIFLSKSDPAARRRVCE